jgi:sarcosine oxidase subunit beta
MVMKTDVVIIGGGIVGCATAYYLARQGRRVVVVEKDAGVGLQASGRNAGGVRQHGRKAALPLAMEAVRLWASLASELESDLEYIRTGNLKVALDEAAAAALEEETAWEHAQGLAEVRMVTAAECQAMIPGLTEGVVAGKFCPTDGVANPMLVTPAYGRAARRLGVEIKTRTTVTGLLRQGTAVRGVMTDVGEIEAEVVVNAAGPWATPFNAMAGCHSPIEPRRAQLLITERQPPRFVPWLIVRGLGYLRQTKASNVLIGIQSKPTNGYGMWMDYADVARQAARMCAALPWLKDVSLIRTWAGITEYTPDVEPYIGPVPGVTGLFVVAGFSGEGFCVGPMAGQIIAEMIAGGEPRVSLAPFQPDRFAARMMAETPPLVPEAEV